VGLLEVSCKIGLAHPLIMLHAPGAPIVVSFDTGNTVYLDPPDHLPVTEYQKNLGAFDRFRLRIRRQCSEEQGRNAALAEVRALHILSDAARVFWEFFETVREADFRKKDSTVAGYPVAQAEEIQDNALVRTCELECFYDGTRMRTIPLSSHPAIQITEHAWNEAQRRLLARETVPPCVSFALDAAYFAECDPVRAVIMACAAWETALRSYLALQKIAPVRDVYYAKFRELYKWMRAAKGGELFYDYYGQGNDEHWDYQRRTLSELPAIRNKLLHEGRASIPEGTAFDAVLAVLDAVEWLV
jgi:hypothetical protein